MSIPHGPTNRAAGSRQRRTLLSVLAVVLVTALVVAVALVLHGSGGSPSSSSATTPPAATTSQSPTSTSSASPTSRSSEATASTSASSETRPSAVAELQPFLSAAARMDRQLHAAATAINAAGPPWIVIGDALVRTVKAADLDVVTDTIPAGMPKDLLLRTLTVYSDLSSRRAAMESFTFEHGPETDPPNTGHRGTEVLLAELKNSVAAAKRFDADLAALKGLAGSSDPFAVAAPSSRAAAETLLLVDWVHKGNWGCDSRGGAVMTELPIITWTSSTGGTLRMSDWPADDSLPFIAKLSPDGRYIAELQVC